MPRKIVEKHETWAGSCIMLVRDPHDFSKEDRWFVEAQLRFDDENTARAVLDKLASMLQSTAAFSPS